MLNQDIEDGRFCDPEQVMQLNQQIMGFLVRRLRQISGISQNSLAIRSETDPSYLSAIERGNGRISLHKMQQVCAALEIEEKQLMHLCSQFRQSLLTGPPDHP